MGCPPVRDYIPRALASGISYVQVDKHGITFLHQIHLCRCCTLRSSCAKVGKDGIRNSYTMACPSVRGDNPRARALMSRVSYVQAD